MREIAIPDHASIGPIPEDDESFAIGGEGHGADRTTVTSVDAGKPPL